VKRGFVFTIDAMLALIPVFIIMSTVTVLSGTDRIAMQAQSVAMSHTAEDTMAVMDKQGDLDDVGRMFANYTRLKEEGDPAWKTEKRQLRRYINRTVPSLIPQRYGFAVEFWGTYPNGTAYLDTEVTSDNRSLTGEDRPFENESSSTSLATKMVTGIEKERPIEGAVARAWLNKIKRRENLYFFGWQRTLSADKCGTSWLGYPISCGNTLNTTMKFTLPGDFNTTNCNSAYADVVVRSGSNTYEAYINGNPMDSLDCNDLQPGRNTMGLDIYNWCWFGLCGYELGTGSGTKVVVDTDTNETTELASSRFEINDIESQCVVKQQMSLFTPGTISSMRVHLEPTNVQNATLALARGADVYHLVTKTGFNLGGDTVDFTDSEISSALASHNLSYSNLSPRVYNLNIYLDINESYEDYHAISNPPPCGGDPHPRTLTNSYVEVDWKPHVRLPSYYIDITRSLSMSGSSQISGSYYEVMTGNYFLPNGTTPWGVDVWTAWQQVGSSNTNQHISEDGITLYSHPPQPFDEYLVRYAYIQDGGTMSQGESNVFRAEGYYNNANDYYGFNPDLSYGTVTYLIYPYAPFGDTYPSVGESYNITLYYDENQDGNEDGSQEVMVNGGGPDRSFCDLDPSNSAVDDAMLRLMDELNFVNDTNPGSYGTDCNYYDGSQDNPVDIVIDPDIKIESEGVGGVTYMHGPLRVRLRVWE